MFPNYTKFLIMFILVGLVITIAQYAITQYTISYQPLEMPTDNYTGRVALVQGDYAYLGTDRIVEKRPLACSSNITMGNSDGITRFNNKFMFEKP